MLAKVSFYKEIVKKREREKCEVIKRGRDKRQIRNGIDTVKLEKYREA